MLGRQELERLSRIARTHAQFDELVARIRAENATEVGVIYVYQVAADCYEVDWELTALPPSLFEAVALAAHFELSSMPCRLVAPKSKRQQRAHSQKPVLQLSEPALTASSGSRSELGTYPRRAAGFADVPVQRVYDYGA